LLVIAINNQSINRGKLFPLQSSGKTQFQAAVYLPTPHQAQRKAHPWGGKTKEFPPKLEYFSKPQKPKFIKLNEILKVFLGNRTGKPSVKFHSSNNMKYFPLTFECRNFG